VHNWLDRQFPGSWIGCRGLVEWPPKSPDLTSLDVYLRGHLKVKVYRVKIQNMGHLKQSIRDAYTHVTPDVLKRVSHEWERRISTPCQSNGALQSTFCGKRNNFPHVWRLFIRPVH